MESTLRWEPRLSVMDSSKGLLFLLLHVLIGIPQTSQQVLRIGKCMEEGRGGLCCVSLQLATGWRGRGGAAGAGRIKVCRVQ